MKGLFKKLAFAAPLVVCLPLCVSAGDAAASNDEPAAKIFEDYSLTSATQDSGDSKIVNTNASMDASAPCVGNQPSAAPCASAPCASAPCAAPACCNTYGEPFCEPKCVFNAGVEATIFHVQTKGMSADSSVSSFINETTFGQSNSQVFDQFTYSPRIWAGVSEDCWGAEARFWYMSDSTNRQLNFDALPPFTGDFTMDRIKAYTIDVEGTYDWCYCGNKIQGFFGFRYASFEAGQGTQVTRSIAPNDFWQTQSLNKFTFNGAGLTMGFLGRCPLTCDGCINFVYGLRGSVLWGEAERSVQTEANVVEVAGSAGSINSAFSDNVDTAFVVEALIGVEWDHKLECLPMCAFLRLGLEYQFWDMGSKGSAESTSFAFSNTGSAVSHGSIGDVDTNMYGFTVATGFTW
ncbi:MAG TPA: hypothetical protein VFG04_21180 [Planctomycetaceae bacterium]|jgi:hypothetical protein|nr:hypothetical protein [Planctomycetaceae bacterium]